MGVVHDAGSLALRCLEIVRGVPLPLLLLFLLTTCLALATLVGSFDGCTQFVCACRRSLVPQLYVALFVAAPVPRPSRRSERTYRTILPDGRTSEPQPLPCWVDEWRACKELAERQKQPAEEGCKIDAAEVFMSVVVPAYNEEDRLGGMLEEAVDFLQRQYGDAHGSGAESKTPSTAPAQKQANGTHSSSNGTAHPSKPSGPAGWEILIVSDGSNDRTVEKALGFAHEHQLSRHPAPTPGPRTPKPTRSTHIPHGSIRVISLEANRGKGGAVTHGMRHVRGQYVVFADADGASEFSDLDKLVRGCRGIEDARGRGVAIGSRAHLVGSEAVVKVCLPRSPAPERTERAPTDTATRSARCSATSSCTRSTCSCGSSRRRRRRRSGTPSAASSCSRGRRCRTSSRTCTPRAGSSTWRC